MKLFHVVSMFIQIDKGVIKKIALGEEIPDDATHTILKRWCSYPKNVTEGNITTLKGEWERCKFNNQFFIVKELFLCFLFMKL